MLFNSSGRFRGRSSLSASKRRRTNLRSQHSRNVSAHSDTITKAYKEMYVLHARLVLNAVLSKGHTMASEGQDDQGSQRETVRSRRFRLEEQAL